MVRGRTEVLFRIAMAVKGIDGAVELIGGILLLLVSQTEVQKDRALRRERHLA